MYAYLTNNKFLSLVDCILINIFKGHLIFCLNDTILYSLNIRIYLQSQLHKQKLEHSNYKHPEDHFQLYQEIVLQHSE